MKKDIGKILGILLIVSGIGVMLLGDQLFAGTVLAGRFGTPGANFYDVAFAIPLSSSTGNHISIRFDQEDRVVPANEPLRITSASYYGRSSSGTCWAPGTSPTPVNLNEPAIEVGYFVDGVLLTSEVPCVNPGAVTCADARTSLTLNMANFSGGYHTLTAKFRYTKFNCDYFPNGTQSPSVPGEWIATAFEEQFYYDDPACILQPNTMVVSESFAAGKTLEGLTDFRWTPKAFCINLPILITEQDRVVEQRFDEYMQLKAGGFYTVAANRTATFFYVVDVNPEMKLICDPDLNQSYVEDFNNTGEPACVVTPGIMHACAEGVFDPAEGICAVQPTSRYVCEHGGYYDIAQETCIIHLTESEFENETFTVPENCQLDLENKRVVCNPTTEQVELINLPQTQLDPVETATTQLTGTPISTSSLVLGAIISIAGAALYVISNKRKAKRGR